MLLQQIQKKVYQLMKNNTKRSIVLANTSKITKKNRWLMDIWFPIWRDVLKEVRAVPTNVGIEAEIFYTTEKYYSIDWKREVRYSNSAWDSKINSSKVLLEVKELRY